MDNLSQALKVIFKNRQIKNNKYIYIYLFTRKAIAFLRDIEI